MATWAIAAAATKATTLAAQLTAQGLSETQVAAQVKAQTGFTIVTGTNPILNLAGKVAVALGAPPSAVNKLEAVVNPNVTFPTQQEAEATLLKAALNSPLSKTTPINAAPNPLDSWSLGAGLFSISNAKNPTTVITGFKL